MDMKHRQELSDLFDRYYDVIVKQCLHMIGYSSAHIDMVEDCVQYAFLQAWIHYDDVGQYTNPAGWISITARKRLMSEMRKTDNRTRIEREHLTISPEQTASELELWYRKNEAKAQMNAILAQLSATEKDVCETYFVEGNTIDETAQQLHMDRNGVRGAIDRIRRKAKLTKLLNFFLIGTWIFTILRNK